MTFFSNSYQQARQKFRQAALAAGAAIHSVPSSGDYEVDVASLILAEDLTQNRTKADSPTLILTSGLHGVEAFFGSAVQVAAMQELQRWSKSDAGLDEIRIVFVHVLNPYGCAQIRRVDENNIDLNRNYPVDDQQYQEAPAAYHKLNGFLNPQSPPSFAEPYRMKAVYNILRYGLPSLKEAIVCGQYHYPQGIFYGGSEPSNATQFVMQHCEEWVGESSLVAHIDLHSGLGQFGDYKILLNEQPDGTDHSWYSNTFGRKSIGSLQNTDQTAYAVTGAMGAWLQRHFSDRKYYFAGAEFGTYDPVRVVGAIRAENRAHHYGLPNSETYRKAKTELLECFCPASEQWRERVINASLQIVSQAIEGLQRSGVR